MKKKLQEELRAVMGQLKTYRDLTEPTEEQTKEYDANLDKQEQLLADIRACDEREARAQALEAQARASVNPLPAGGPAPVPGGAQTEERGVLRLDSLRVPATARRAADPKRGFSDNRMAYAFARMALATGQGVVAERSRAWLRDNGLELRAGQVEGNDTLGGYLVAPELSTEVIRLVGQYGIFRRFAKYVPMGSSERNQPKRTGGLTVYPGSELGSMTASQMSYGNVNLNARKWYTFPRTSNELNDDSLVDIGNELATEIAYAFARKEDECGFLGDGTSTYHRIEGLKTALTGVASNYGVVAGAGNTLAEVTSANLLTMKSRIPSYVRQLDPSGIRWFCTTEFESAAFETIALAAGGVTADNWMNSNVRSFLGIPIEIAEALVDETGNSEVPCYVGSLQLAAMFGSRNDVEIAMSEHSSFTSDALDWRAIERFDINVHERGTSAAAGPVVALQLAAS